MELRRKDNLTDLVGSLPKEPGGNGDTSQEDPKNQEVITEGGEVVILGHKRPPAPPINNRRNSLELTEGESLAGAVRSGMRDVLERFFANYKQNKDK